MTPLAREIVIEAARAPNRRRFLCDGDPVEWAKKISGAAMFDCRAVHHLLSDLFPKLVRTHLPGYQLNTAGFVFLPSDVTWIEWRVTTTEGDGGVGILLEDMKEIISFSLFVRADQVAGKRKSYILLGYSGFFLKAIDAISTADVRTSVWARGWKYWGKIDHKFVEAFLWHTLGNLAIINANRGGLPRREHAPDPALARKVFPREPNPGLRPWTEVLLPANADRMTDAERDKLIKHIVRHGVAWHPVRRHNRTLRDGRTVNVKEHHRGDKKYGIVQKTYRVTAPPSSGAAP